MRIAAHCVRACTKRPVLDMGTTSAHTPHAHAHASARARAPHSAPRYAPRTSHSAQRKRIAPPKPTLEYVVMLQYTHRPTVPPLPALPGLVHSSTAYAAQPTAKMTSKMKTPTLMMSGESAKLANRSGARSTRDSSAKPSKAYGALYSRQHTEAVAGRAGGVQVCRGGRR
jgi:hypothetical protein